MKSYLIQGIVNLSSSTVGIDDLSGCAPDERLESNVGTK
jgi:hypothetical protein